ncbi:hypothetical protein HDU97_005585 [Phlyctochytrium planicorne]|nr:hypothetical protein HDU97_005585 [Phlyctochytrium planicorne]
MEQNTKDFKLTKMVKDEDIAQFTIKFKQNEKEEGSTINWSGDADSNNGDGLEVPYNSRFRSEKSNRNNRSSDLFDKDSVSTGDTGMDDDDDDDDFGRDTFLDDIYDIVDSVVPTTDNVNTPALTFRVMVIGIILFFSFAVVNTIFTFRTNEFFLSPLIGVLLAYPLGALMSRTLPRKQLPLPFTQATFSFNPGPFSLKEHALLYIISSAASNPAYALYNIVAQRRIQQEFGPGHSSYGGKFWWAIAFALGCQLLGYGVAGLCRRYLVRPAAMLWPANLSIVAILTSLHAARSSPYDTWEEESEARLKEEQRKPVWKGVNSRQRASWESMDSAASEGYKKAKKDARAGESAGNEDSASVASAMQQAAREDGKKKFRFFWIAAICMFFYQFGPAYVAPGLAAVSLMCYASSETSQIARMLGSPRHGLGMFAMTFDWTVVTVVQPITTPLWALLNQVIGLYIMFWLVIPLLWNANAFGGDKLVGTNPLQGPNGTGEFPLGLAMNSAALFDKNGTSIAITDLLVLTSVSNDTTSADPSNAFRSLKRGFWSLKSGATFSVGAPGESSSNTTDTTIVDPTNTNITDSSDPSLSPDNSTDPSLSPESIQPTSLTYDYHTNMVLDEEKYAALAPIRITTYFAVEYGAAFMAFTATMVHVWLWYGKDILMRFRTQVMRDLDTSDIHARLMDKYPEVPDMWYLFLLIATTFLVIASGQWGGFDLPWWSTLLALLLVLVTIVPIGVIQAISGQFIGLNVVSEFMAGYILQGRMSSVMAFKTVAYMGVFQGLGLTQDLKLGHYLKVPPRTMMGVQALATAGTAIVNVVVAEWVFERFGDKIEGRVEAIQYEVFMNAGAIWGLIGPRRFFGSESPYQPLLLCFAIGAVLPFIPYGFHKLGNKFNRRNITTSSSATPQDPESTKKSTILSYLNPLTWSWHLVNIPLLVAFPVTVSSLRSDLITPIILALTVNLLIRRLRPDWWKTYAYAMSAAFDAGAGVAITIVFLAFAADRSGKIMTWIPYYPLNRFDLDGCAPRVYVKCNELISVYGYNSTLTDPECYGFGNLGLEANHAPALPKQSQTMVEEKQYDPNSTRQTGAEAYSFASEPKAVAASRKKYRDPNEKEQRPPPVNIMYDRRIHRGNTYASPVIPLHAQPDPVEIQRQNEIKRRIRAKRRAEAQRRVRTPEAVDGRRHVDVQTDLYLEELSDKVPEAFAATQTDAFLDRAPSPLYIPQKNGLDVATQVLEGELFNFDYEVAPLLEVIVGKTIEQALMEVMEEEEMETLRKHQRDHEEKRNAELAEVQRLEDAERRRTEEKERRLAEQIRILKEKQEAAEKISARAFAQAYLANLVPSVLDSLSTNGYFYDTIEKEVETLFLPWLSSEVDKNVDKLKMARNVVDDIIRNAVRALRNNGVAPAPPTAKGRK